jgi:hypothetical protein
LSDLERLQADLNEALRLLRLCNRPRVGAVIGREAEETIAAFLAAHPIEEPD